MHINIVILYKVKKIVINFNFEFIENSISEPLNFFLVSKKKLD